MWYIVIVFFASGSITGPAHFEENWYPRPMLSFEMCERVGLSVLTHLSTSTTIQGEAYEVACIRASSLETLTEQIHDQWTFEPAPSAPPVSETPV